MPDFLPGYTGQAAPMNPRPAPPSPEEKLAQMSELLSTDMLGLLARLIQRGAAKPPPPQMGMPPQQPAGIPGVSGAMPMMPQQAPQNMMPNPGFVRG
jgi:hypothetical protein